MKITILTGAGISAESGLGTFRSKDGIWAKYDLAKVATPEAFATDPAMVHEFYNLRRKACIEAQPNAAHFALAELQKTLPDVTIVTQNVDDLHERAGARDVLHMHGELMRARCSACGHRWPASATMSSDDFCPDCNATAARPDVVWFGEYPYFTETIAKRVRESDLFVVIGSSGQVYPAAGFLEIADSANVETLELNLERNGQVFDESIIGPATQTVPEWVSRIIASCGK